MKLLIFLHGTLIMHSAAAGLPRPARVQQVMAQHPSVRDFSSYAPIGAAVKKCQGWADQGATLVYLSSNQKEEDLQADQQVLSRFHFPEGEVYFRSECETYRDVALRVSPDVVIEDDCESIGGLAEMVWPNLPAERKPPIKSWR